MEKADKGQLNPLQKCADTSTKVCPMAKYRDLKGWKYCTKCLEKNSC